MNSNTSAILAEIKKAMSKAPTTTTLVLVWVFAVLIFFFILGLVAPKDI